MRLLQDLGWGGVWSVPQLHRAKGPARGDGGVGAACAETAVPRMQSGSSMASESSLYLFNEHPHCYQGFLWG